MHHLVTEKISQEGLDNLRNSGYEVDEKLDLSPEKLMEEIVKAQLSSSDRQPPLQTKL